MSNLTSKAVPAAAPTTITAVVAPRQITLGSRTSALAMWQTNFVVAALQAHWPTLDCRIVPFTTQGDKTQAQNKPLPEIGGKGLFTLELEEALRSGAIDVAVHSLKDLPVENAPGLTLGAIFNRADVRDVLITRNGETLHDLPQGAIVGTSSTRRAAQLLAIRPDLQLKPIRGNVETRMRKVLQGDYDATVLAAAGLTRLGLDKQGIEWLPLDVMLPAPGQGALAVQCRADDVAVLAALAALDDAAVRNAVTAERTFLNALGGGCSAPVAAYAQPVDGDPQHLTMQALIAAPNGQQVICVHGKGAAATLGQQLAEQALNQGAQASLNPQSANRPLENLRIVITRTVEQAEPMAAELRSLGAHPLIMPTIALATLTDQQALNAALAQLASYDWLLFTSANAVTIFADALRAQGTSLADYPQLGVATVGPATAEAVRNLGIEPALQPAEFVAEALAAALQPHVHGKRILLPQAAAARPVLADLLAQDATITVIPLYETQPLALTAEHLAELRRGVDVVCFTSSSTVRNFVAAVTPQADVMTAVHKAVIACIGPITAETAREQGLAVGLVAEEHSSAGLLQALIAYTKEHPQHA